jgi:hypothetical protein
MSTWMNDYDIEIAYRQFGDGGTPNRFAAVCVVNRLRLWTDANSDGWAYWPKPARAASKAMDLIASTTNQANDEKRFNDASDRELRAALSPIKAFLTRQNVPAGARAEIFQGIRA